MIVYRFALGQPVLKVTVSTSSGALTKKPLAAIDALREKS